MAAAEARSHGHGGIAAVVRATGISGSTVLRGLAELESGELPAPGRVRRPGGGKRPISETQPGIEDELERLVAPETRGDRESPLRWTSRSAVKLTRGLAERGYEVSESIAADEPAISIDSKNASLVGDFKAVGRELEPTGCPVAVRSHDFKDKQLGHAIPHHLFRGEPTHPRKFG